MVKEKDKIELHDDAWHRFERAADAVAKSPPQHRVAKKPRRRQVKRRASSSKP